MSVGLLAGAVVVCVLPIVRQSDERPVCKHELLRPKVKKHEPHTRHTRRAHARNGCGNGCGNGFETASQFTTLDRLRKS